MKVQIRTTDGDTLTDIISTPIEKLEYRESLLNKLTEDGKVFEFAIVSYDSEVILEIKTLDELINELGKYGI